MELLTIVVLSGLVVLLIIVLSFLVHVCVRLREKFSDGLWKYWGKDGDDFYGG